MPLKPVLLIINVFLALAAFLAVGAVALTRQEEMFWAVGKAVVCFVVCWFVLGWLANLLSFAVDGERPEVLAEHEPAGQEPGAGDGKG